MLALAIGGWCATHENAARCQIDSPSSAIAGWLLVGAIVLLVLIDVYWRLRYGRRGPVSTLIVRAVRAITAQGRRARRHRAR